MHLKWKIWMLSCLVVTALVVSGTAVRSFVTTSRLNAPPPVPTPAVAEQYTDYASAVYILKESDGYVAVFSSNGTQPLQTTAIRVNGLRQADQALLKDGITAASQEELLSLLEDFGS